MVTSSKTHNPNVVIIGASDGIGFCLTRLFGDETENLIGVGRRSSAVLPARWPATAKYFQGDQTAEHFAETFERYLSSLGWDHIDYLVLNAAVGMVSEPQHETVENITNTIETNLSAPMEIAHRFHRHLQNAPDIACLTMIGSTSHKGSSNFASYSASKAGLAGLGRALAQEWIGNIDVQVIHPGPTATRMHEKAGLNIGLAGRFFISPEYSARKIRALMNKRVMRANVGFTARGIDRLKGLVGFGVK